MKRQRRFNDLGSNEPAECCSTSFTARPSREQFVRRIPILSGDWNISESTVRHSSWLSNGETRNVLYYGWMKERERCKEDRVCSHVVWIDSKLYHLPGLWLCSLTSLCIYAAFCRAEVMRFLLLGESKWVYIWGHYLLIAHGLCRTCVSYMTDFFFFFLEY